MRRKARNEPAGTPPLIRRPVASGRGATEQPNVAGDAKPGLTPLFWLMVVLTAVATGLLGDLLMFVLFSMRHLAFNDHAGSLQAAAERASDLRRVGSLLLAGLLGAVSWCFIRRNTKGESSEIDDQVWNGEGRLSFLVSLNAEMVIGMGASIRRETAPKLASGASGSVLASWARRAALQCGDERLLSSRALSSRGTRARSPRSCSHRGSDVMTTSVVRDRVKTADVEHPMTRGSNGNPVTSACSSARSAAPHFVPGHC